MESKLQYISTLASQTALQITGGAQKWIAFLKTSAQFYKYPFEDQILIYAQRPNATACASIDVWNRRMNRWVNPGAKGIALIAGGDGRPHLRYVFDAADTHPGKGAKELRLWKMREDFLAPSLLMKSADGAAANEIGGTGEPEYRLLAASVEYVVLTRCGYDAGSYVSLESLDAITGYSSIPDLARLGHAQANASETLLRRVEHEVKQAVRESAVILAKQDRQDYNNSGDTRLHSLKGDASHGTDVHEKRGLPDPGSENGSAAGGRTREIRPNEGEVPQGAPERDVHGPAAQREVMGTPAGNRPDGSEARGSDDQDVGGTARGERSAESLRSDALGAGNEQHPGDGGRDDSKRTDLQLNGNLGAADEESAAFPSAASSNEYEQISLFPTAEEQIKQISRAEDEKSPAFLIPQTGVTRSGDTSTTEKGIRLHTVVLDFSGDQREEGKQVTPDGVSGGKSAAKTDADADIPVPLKAEILEYDALKAKYPETMIAFQVDSFMLFYGSDAEKAAPLLETRTVGQELPGIGKIPVTGVPKSYWANVLDPLCAKGYNVLVSGILGNGERSIFKHWTAKEYLPVGGRLVIDHRNYEIENVDFADDKVSLKDLSFQEGAGFPISRIEPVSFVRSYWEEQSLEEENWHLFYENELPKTVGSLSPQNFRITDDHLGEGGQKTKYGYNITAIRTLKQIEAEGHAATPEEQETLSRYVGWGGIPQAFDERNQSWHKEYGELKEALTDEEYRAARASVLNAHYTSPTVIRAVYSALARMGFQHGNVLEPAMGVGNFFGLLPESMTASRLYGVELDGITGRIAKQLYPKANITISGFENTNFSDDFFDIAVGNVPFGEYKLFDKRYDKYNFLIHDYFFAKALDKVRPGGIIAFITSKGTMDKQNDGVRRYLAERADLLGAVRLPNNAFLANAGTEVTSDILFLQKRDRLSAEEPEWLEIGETEDGIPVNRYFLSHPEMLLGTMAFDKRMYGSDTETTCRPIEGANLAEQLKAAFAGFLSPADISPTAVEDDSALEENNAIPADPDVRNYSFTFAGSRLYFRENSLMRPVTDLSDTAKSRVSGMIGIRDSARRLIALELGGAGDDAVREEQAELNELYDDFSRKYGIINSFANKRVFEQDSSYCLLCSLEVLDENGAFRRKADMFSKRTIRQRVEITSVDTAVEALAVSLGEKARVDIPYMASLLGGADKTDRVLQELRGIIFKNPETGGGPLDGWETSEEYLSGNVREKLRAAQQAARQDPAYSVNVEALEKVRPKDLTASEIGVRLGATWVDPETYRQFMAELLNPPKHLLGKGGIDILYSPVTGAWNITGKNLDSCENVLANVTYGTDRANAYSILENSLNLKQVRIYDVVSDADGEHRVPNDKETAVAQQKQEAMKQAFREWIWSDSERRERLCKTYNEIFNCIRPREYDGSHIRFVGMNPEITLRPHQRNAVAHVLYGKNTLLAHCVGAGKTYEMTAAAMESKRLGLCHKSMFVVPNHLTEQWGGDFLNLYPGANILVATKKDFEMQNRKKFCARIATGDYDAVIIGHSQFMKIPVSKERQIKMIEDQISEIEVGIEQAKESRSENFTVKQMEKTRKNLEAKLKQLNDDSHKDDVVTFEELGIDHLYIDEADSFKNLFLYTKMRNVAGIGQTEAQKSSDMYMKCRYMDELTGGRGVTFATGTPISNSMTELFTMMRYLQYDTLQSRGLAYFDSWASTFGETVTATELAPEGTGFRTKTRFAKFFNLPELMAMWKESADIQTADMLRLPVPEAEHVNVVTQPSDSQKDGVRELADRAEHVRARLVDPQEDNMLRITNDGRLLALDQRLKDPASPDDPGSKGNACVKNVLTEWRNSEAFKGTQLIFCDLSTPHGDGTFNVYDDVRNKLIAAGVPAGEIAFIHDAKTDAQKEELFAKVRQGAIRILLGSTAKMGAGTNVQDRLIAEHHLDCPWKPRDIEQREGRIVRQGNRNPKVRIYRYVTEGTFDAYCWQLIENKQKFISQIMTGKSPARSCADVDESVLSYAEVKALATGDPRIREKMDLEIEVAKLKTLKSGFLSQHFALEDKLAKTFPKEIAQTRTLIDGISGDIEYLAGYPEQKDDFNMVLNGKTYTDKKAAGTALIDSTKKMSVLKDSLDAGSYLGMSVRLHYDHFGTYRAALKHGLSYSAELGTDPLGNITRINNLLDSLPQRLEKEKTHLAELQKQTRDARVELQKSFPQETELSEKSARLDGLTVELSADQGIAVPEETVKAEEEPAMEMQEGM